MMIHEKPLEVGASFGFAMYPNDAKDATKLLRLADQRMYFLKKRPVRTARLEAEMAVQAQ